MDNINNTTDTTTLQIPNLKSYMYLMLLEELYKELDKIEKKDLVKTTNK
jgi:hypothetical protein